MIYVNTKAISDVLRLSRNQSEESSTLCDVKVNSTGRKNNKTSKKSDYDNFLIKYESLPTTIGFFGTKDLVFFFREKAKEQGIKYVINNISRDMGVFKRLQDSYSVQEIMLMIEFLFSGDQTYIKPSGTSPTVLVSGWGNKIYHDSIAWANDEYVETKKKSGSSTESREWTKTEETNYTKIGEWDE